MEDLVPVSAGAVAPMGGAVTTVLVVDAHDIARAGMCGLLSIEADFDIVGQAASVDEAVRLAVALKPALILVAIGPGRLDGHAAVRAIKSASPSAVVIGIGDVDQASQLMTVLEAGAGGFLLIDTCQPELLVLLRQAARTGAAIAPELATQLLVRMADLSRGARDTPDALTPREIDVLRLIAQGDTNREIAHRLRVAVGTVKIHIEHILTKLGAPGRTAAAMRGIELGLIQVSGPLPDTADPQGSALD